MIGALIILAVTVVAGVILYLLDRRNNPSADESPADQAANNGLAENLDASHNTGSNEEGNEQNPKAAKASSSQEGACCGLHLVCEKELTAIAEDRILYYDDEELDRFIGRQPDEYNAEETEEFREVLLTLLPQDVAGWARSLDRRNIRPPQEIRDELLIMLQEIV